MTIHTLGIIVSCRLEIDYIFSVIFNYEINIQLLGIADFLNLAELLGKKLFIHFEGDFLCQSFQHLYLYFAKDLHEKQHSKLTKILQYI